MREEGLRNIIIAPTREGRKVDRWGKGWRGGQGSIGFTFSSESVLKVTYGNVEGIKKFSPAAGFHSLLNCPHP